MSTLYHLSASGKINPCHASKRSCPLGLGSHFDKPAYERIINNEPSGDAEISAWFKFRDQEITKRQTILPAAELNEKIHFIVNDYGYSVNSDIASYLTGFLSASRVSAMSSDDKRTFLTGYLRDKTILSPEGAAAASGKIVQTLVAAKDHSPKFWQTHAENMEKAFTPASTERLRLELAKATGTYHNSEEAIAALHEAVKINYDSVDQRQDISDVFIRFYPVSARNPLQVKNASKAISQVLGL